jgi:hypothetical protein
MPETAAATAKESVGAAFGMAGQLQASGHEVLARALHGAASSAFFDGFELACLVAAGVAMAGALLAAALIPAQPPRLAEARELPA